MRVCGVGDVRVYAWCVCSLVDNLWFVFGDFRSEEIDV